MQNLRAKAYSLLRKSEAIFKTDMIYLAKGGFWQAFGQVSSSIFSLFLVLTFANLVPKETYGLYRYILSLAGILGIFTLTGMNRSVTQAVASGYDGALKAAVTYQLKWSLLMMGAFWGLAGYYFLHHNTQIAISLMIMSVCTPLVQSFNTYGAYLEAKKEFRLNNIFSAISVCIYVAGMMVAILLSGHIVWLIFAYSITTAMTTIVFYGITIKMVEPVTHDSGEVLRYGKHLTFIGLIAPISSQIDSIIITHFWGTAQLALYSLALAIPSRAVSFIKSFVDLGFPKLVGRTVEEIESIYSKRIFQGLIVGIGCAIVYISLAPYIFTYVIPQYIESIHYSQVLALGMITAMPNRYHSTLFESRKLSKLILTNGIIQSFIKITLYIVLGIWGGILGLTFAYVINSLISLIINMSMWRFKTFFYNI